VTTSRPEIVFFDLGDTLVRAEPSWAAVYLSGLAQHGIEVDERALAAAMAATPWSLDGPFEATEEASYARLRAFDESILAQLGHTGLPDGVFRTLDELFQRPATWHLFPDVVPGLRGLRAAGIRTGLISNWGWAAPALLAALGLADLLEIVVVSARAGWHKPYPGIFRRALDEAGVTADGAVHAGDSFANDVVGARAAGLRPVLIDRALRDPARATQRVPPGDPVPVVSDLLGLLDLLGVMRGAPAPA
jgi:putative hydrolase of the HAD superfamily